MSETGIKSENGTNTSRKRDIVKNVLIVFLAVMLVLTFYSNTIMNKSLAEVSTERSASGKLTERVRGSGLVESNQIYEVTVNGNKTVETIFVKRGQEVSKGTVLFTVGTEESAELTEAETLLASLELEYQKAILEPSENYSKENQAINNARSDLESAIAKRDSAINNQSVAESAKADYSYNKSQLNYYTKLQTKLQSTITAIDLDEYTGAAAEYTGELIKLKNDMDSAEKDYTNANTLYVSLLTSETSVLQEVIDSAKTDCDDKSAALIDAKEKYESKKFAMRAEMVEQLSDAEGNVDRFTSLVEEYENSLTGGGISMSIEELDADIESKQRILEELITDLSQTKDENSTQSKINALEIDAKKKELDKQKEKVSKMREKLSVTEIVSEYSGVISDISVKPGEITVPEMSCMVIDLVDEGFTASFSIAADKTKKIKIGTAAEVMNNWNGDIEAVLTNIKSDTTAGSKNKILVFSLKGNVDSGSYIDLSVPCSTSNYDVIVPKNAVYEDSNGKFVLIVESKSSPLGNRYYARRVDVEVLASDEISSAVSGNVMSGDYVITASSMPVKPNDQVRMRSD